MLNSFFSILLDRGCTHRGAHPAQAGAQIRPTAISPTEGAAGRGRGRGRSSSPPVRAGGRRRSGIVPCLSRHGPSRPAPDASGCSDAARSPGRPPTAWRWKQARLPRTSVSASPGTRAPRERRAARLSLERSFPSIFPRPSWPVHPGAPPLRSAGRSKPGTGSRRGQLRPRLQPAIISASAGAPAPSRSIAARVSRRRSSWPIL